MKATTRILVENGSYGLQNHGDTAMLQTAVSRLRALWPDARLQVVTAAPERLALCCPGAEPLAVRGRQAWFQAYRLSRLSHRFPVVGRWERTLRCRQPRLWASFSPRDRETRRDFDAFQDALLGADLVVVSGGGFLNDSFHQHAERVLDTLEIAIRRRVPTALLGQGIGPITNAELANRAKEVLPRVDLIALREGAMGLPLLDSWGVERGKVMVTGDDAIELAYRMQQETLGNSLGINLRLAAYAEVESTEIATLRAVLQQVTARYGMPLLPIPISFSKHSKDTDTIQQILTGVEATPIPLPPLDTLCELLEQVGRCRLMVTGSYHAGVFALAQGVPALCLAKSAYYQQKFEGLAAQFGAGCTVVRLDTPTLAQTLFQAIERSWLSAEQPRCSLLQKAQLQIGQSHAAYQRLWEMMER